MNERAKFLAAYRKCRKMKQAYEECGLERHTVLTWVSSNQKFRDAYYAIKEKSDAELKAEVLEKYMECGSITRACSLVGVSTSLFYNWYDDKEFKKSYQANMKLLKDKLIDKGVEIAMAGDKWMLLQILDRIERGQHAARVINSREKETIEDAEYVTDNPDSLQDIQARVISLASAREDAARAEPGEDRPVLPAKVYPGSQRH